MADPIPTRTLRDFIGSLPGGTSNSVLGDDLTMASLAAFAKTADLGDLAKKDKAEISDIDATGTPNSGTYLRGDGTWQTPAGAGDMSQAVYDPTGVNADAFDRANHHGDIDAGDIDGLAAVATSGDYDDLANKPSLAEVATSGDYDDLTGKPTLGTAAAADTGDFATAAQGGLADTAVQPADIADMLIEDDIGVTVQGYDAATAKTDVAQQFSKPQRASATPVTSATTMTIDLAANNDFEVTAYAHNGTLANPTNQSTQINQKGTITITQDGTGGRTLSFGSNWKAIGSASAPSINTTAGVTSCIDYHVLSSTVIRYSLRPVGAA